MSREIKFRAWMYWESKMVNSFDNPELFVFAENGLNIKTETDQLYYPRVSFMQYTGLKDKSGKDVCEGDVVECFGEDEIYNGEERGTIHSIRYCGENDYPAFDLFPRVECESNGLSYYLAVGHIKIIGNIYENSNLLESE